MNYQKRSIQEMRSYLEKMRQQAIKSSPVRQQQYTAQRLFRIRSFSRCEQRPDISRSTSQIFSEKKDLLPIFRRSLISRKRLFSKDIKQKRSPEVINRLKIESVHFQSRDKLKSSRFKQEFEYSQLLPSRNSQQIKRKQPLPKQKIVGDYKMKTQKVIKKRKYFNDSAGASKQISMNLEPW